jgi:hypothetical protein
VGASKTKSMNKKISVLAVFLLCAFYVSAQDQPLKKGMKITRSVKIKRGNYIIGATATDASGPVISIEGNGITVDFNQAVMDGNTTGSTPDMFTGIAIVVKGKNITIKNLFAKGYKIALYANGVDGLIIDNCDLSYNYRPRLNSTQEKEDISDWMSYHHNEKDEWMRYGAAIYLRKCNNGKMSNTRVTGGQNAMMMTECDGWLIWKFGDRAGYVQEQQEPGFIQPHHF